MLLDSCVTCLLSREVVAEVRSPRPAVPTNQTEPNCWVDFQLKSVFRARFGAVASLSRCAIICWIRNPFPKPSVYIWRNDAVVSGDEIGSKVTL